MVYVGKIVNTHGLKGEIRIISNLLEKDSVFIINNNLIIDNNEYKILSYRKHKNYDMVFLENVSYDEAIKLKNKSVYIKREDIKLDFIKTDIIGMMAYNNDKLIGKVTKIINGKQDIIEIDNNILIPYVKEFISKIEDNKVYINVIKGLIDED